MRIGVISDTHSLLHPRVFEVFEGVDHILHAGDIGDEDVLLALAELAPLTVVAGNIDGFSKDWRRGGVSVHAGEFARVTLGGSRFLLTHDLHRPRALRAEVERELARAPADVVVFGHSHLPHDELLGGIRFFNPASSGPRRFDYPCSVGLFEQRADGWATRHLGLDARSTAVLAEGRYLNQLSRGATPGAMM